MWEIYIKALCLDYPYRKVGREPVKNANCQLMLSVESSSGRKSILKTVFPLRRPTQLKVNSPSEFNVNLTRNQTCQKAQLQGFNREPLRKQLKTIRDVP